MSEIMLRKYTENDEPALVSMTTGSDYAEDPVGTNREKLTIAEYNGTVAGYSYANICSGESHIFVYVSPEYRRRGIGTVLYNEAETRCHEADGESVFSQYYGSENGVGFAYKLGFSYTRKSDYMKYTGGIMPEIKYAIRKYRDEDYLRCNYIIARGFHELRVSIGVADSKMSSPSEEIRKRYHDMADNYYVMEDGGQIIGCGCIDGNEIGTVAVDMDLNNRGYGRALSTFLTNEIIRRGNDAAYIWCEAGNNHARHIYDIIGYREVCTKYFPVKNLI